MKLKAAGFAGLLVLLLVSLLGVTLAGQDKRPNEDSNTRSVQGIVTDAANNPVAGAVVQLKDIKTLGIRSFRTESDGSYHFAGLSTNEEYELKADHDGATSGKKTLTVFNSQKTATINLKLNK
ncbi:MAG TPA: carboxypeptidase-like regulatory domain-containing protein [Bryobacteraceae bacterium]|nr:carboxypeptidase-like regulatory domain-containing protein [Bryobacteraceae bacterium]